MKNYNIIYKCYVKSFIPIEFNKIMQEKIMDVKEANIKEKFAERYKSLLGKDYDTFIKYSLTFPRRSLRVNTLKISVEELKKRLEKKWELTQIPWCKEGFWIRHIKGERRDIGNLIEFW